MASETEKLLEQILRAIERMSVTQTAPSMGSGSAAAPSAIGAPGRGRGGRASDAAGGAAGAAGRGATGGLAGRVAAGGPVAAAAAAGADLIGQGAIAASQGGTFGGGVKRGLLKLAAKVPVLGEVEGYAPALRITEGTESDLNSVTNQVARFAGSAAVTPRVRKFLTKTFKEQNQNIEQDRQANRAATNESVPGPQSGAIFGVMPELIAGLTKLSEALAGFNHNASGANQRT